MANGIAGQIGQQTSQVAFGGTNAQVMELFRLFLLDKQPPPPDGLTNAQLQQYYLDMAMPEIKAYVKGQARRNKLREGQAAAETQADAATDL